MNNNIYYYVQGPSEAPILILSNSLGCHLRMWDDVMPFLLPHYRVLRYDARGHGSNRVGEGAVGPDSIATLGQDVLYLLDRLGVPKASFCGISMGGLIGQYLGIQHPERVERLILANTGAKIGDHATWETRIQIIEKEGLAGTVEGTMERWFTPGFRTQHPERVEAVKSMFLDNDLRGYSNCCRAIQNADFREDVKNITQPVLIIGGQDDPVTTLDHASFLKNQIPNSQLVVLPTRHLSAMEMPVLFAQEVLNFLQN